MTQPYTAFLARKRSTVPTWGFDCDAGDVSGDLFPFQRHIVAWAVRRGRAAVFADTGLGKTRMQLAWADRMTRAGGRALILAPLAVAQQTIREATVMGLDVRYARDGADVAGRLSITNYDRLHLFAPAEFTAVVFDDAGYVLPALNLIPHLLPVNTAPDGELFAVELGGVSGRAKVRRETLAARVDTAVDLARADERPWLLWCGLNEEAERLTAGIPGAVNVHGSLDADRKADLLLGFADGQHCARMAFVGLASNVARKEANARAGLDALIHAQREYQETS